MIWRGYSRNNYGYLTPRSPAQTNAQWYVHRVAYMAYTENHVHLRKGCDVSHLCHRSLCVCFEHFPWATPYQQFQKNLQEKPHMCGAWWLPWLLGIWTTMSCKFLEYFVELHFLPIDLYHGHMVQPSWFSTIQINVTKPRLAGRIVWFLFVQWIVAFVTAIGYREHDQDGSSMIKVYYVGQGLQ